MLKWSDWRRVWGSLGCRMMIKRIDVGHSPCTQTQLAAVALHREGEGDDAALKIVTPICLKLLNKDKIRTLRSVSIIIGLLHTHVFYFTCNLPI
jgi:hypothetical protein